MKQVNSSLTKKINTTSELRVFVCLFTANSCVPDVQLARRLRILVITTVRGI